MIECLFDLCATNESVHLIIEVFCNQHLTNAIIHTSNYCIKRLDTVWAIFDKSFRNSIFFCEIAIISSKINFIDKDRGWLQLTKTSVKVLANLYSFCAHYFFLARIFFVAFVAREQTSDLFVICGVAWTVRELTFLLFCVLLTYMYTSHFLCNNLKNTLGWSRKVSSRQQPHQSSHTINRRRI